jgi:hypothetical protein
MKIDDPKKNKRCLVCEKKVHSFCFCVDCWDLLPNKLRDNLIKNEKDGDIEEVKRLVVEGCNLLKISSELKNIKNCLICGKKFGFLSAPINTTGICIKCKLKQPEKWQKELALIEKNKRYDQMKILVDRAVQGNFAYEIIGLEGLLVSSHGLFKYKGGHPDFSTLTSVSLTDKPEGIVAFDNKTKKIFFTVKWDRITSISADKEVVTKSSVGLSAIGLLAGRPDLTIMGAAWKNNKENNFLNIGYRYSGMETTISFEGKKAGEAAAYYISLSSKYRGDTDGGNGNCDKMKQASSDPIDQIKKLAELKDAGILTEDEFKTKKEKLLSII